MGDEMKNPYTEEKSVEFQLGRIEAASAGFKQLILARGGVRHSLRNRPMDRVYLSPKPKMLTTGWGILTRPTGY